MLLTAAALHNVLTTSPMFPQSYHSLGIMLKHEQSCRHNLEFDPYGDVFRECQE